MAFTKINAAGIGTTETVTVDGLTVINDGSFGGNLTVSGVLTYEDVTNVDSVGLITARNGIVVGSGITLSKDGDIFATGITTVTTVKSTTGIVTTLTATGLTVDSGTTNTCATFKSTDAGAVINLTDSAARSSIEQNDTTLKIIADTDASDADSKIQFQVDASTKATIDSSGRLLIGNTTTLPAFGASSSLQVAGTGFASGSMLIRRDSDNAFSGALVFGKSRGSLGGNTVVQSGDQVGSIIWTAADGTDLTTDLAQIKAKVDGTPGSNDMPGRIEFHTTADGASGVTERLRIDSSGDYLFLGGTLRIKNSANDAQHGAIYGDSTSFHVNAGGILKLYSGGGQRITMASNGDVGIGTATVLGDSKVHINDSSLTNYRSLVLESVATNGSTMIYRQNGAQVISIGSGGGNNLSGSNVTHGLIRSEVATVFAVGNSQKARIDSDGKLRLGSGTPSWYYDQEIPNSNSDTKQKVARWVQGGQNSLELNMYGGTEDLVQFAVTNAEQNLSFVTENSSSVSASTTKGIYIQSGGDVFIGATANSVVGSGARFQVRYSKTYEFGQLIRPDDNDTGGGQPMIFQNAAGASIGSIGGNASNASFNTSSDYRLKENVISLSDGITRVKQLSPKRFNWIVDETNTLQDGFLAHEVQTVVPESVTGTKDETNDDGSVKPQQLDHSKLVPVLTAAIQELIAEVETLKTEVAALKG